MIVTTTEWNPWWESRLPISFHCTDKRNLTLILNIAYPNTVFNLNSVLNPNPDPKT